MNNPEKLANKLQRIPEGQSEMNNPEKLANKRQRIPEGQSKMNNPEKLANKRQRIPEGQSEMNNPEKLATKQKHNTICVGHHYMQIKGPKQDIQNRLRSLMPEGGDPQF